MNDFFSTHEYDALLLMGLALFPRITLLFVGGPFGWLAWTGWFIAPHVTVAVLATLRYGETNPILVGISWFFALMGTAHEASRVKNNISG